MPTPKEEGLTIMQFMRRPDLDHLTRVEIATQAFLRMGVYGETPRLAQSYQVSRLFVYKLVWQLLTVYALRVGCDQRSLVGAFLSA
jgi:hypothetical protein